MVQNVNEGEKMMEIDLKVAVRAVHFFFQEAPKLNFAPNESIASSTKLSAPTSL